MATNANVEVDMSSTMQTISTFSLSCSQNCTGKCYEGRQRGRFRRTMDSMGQSAEVDEEVGTNNSAGADVLAR